MYIDYPEQLSEDIFLDKDLYFEILAIESELERQLIADKVREQAKNLGIAGKFDARYKAAQRDFSRIQKRELANTSEEYGLMQTQFKMLKQDPGGQLVCGDWVADDEGVRIQTDRGIAWACQHPIFISKTLRNVETGKYKAEIVFQLPGKAPQKTYVDRRTLTTTNQIVNLADDGVIVNQHTAPFLVKYLADLQTLNPLLIQERSSTSRLGWIDGFDADGKPIKQFLPYQSEVIFDNAESMPLFNSIKPHGDREAWYKCVKAIRKKKQPEVLLNMAASFASVLVDVCGGNSFIISLWGESGIGKTVILKLCTSIWANPKEGQYISSSKSTYVGTETRLNILNSLPLTIDDMAQLTMQSEESIQEIIYLVCAGQGKTRGQKTLTTRQSLHWKNCTITNGERSMVDESMQGGAINRVIDIESSGEKLFDNGLGNKVVMTIEENYGFAGQEYIYHLTEMGFDAINDLYSKNYDIVREVAKKKNVEKEDKQIAPMAMMLTADEISEKYLFKDGIRIDIDQAIDYLRNKGEISENKRTYEYLMNVIAENQFRFDDVNADHTNQWGYYLTDERYVAINGNRFDAIIKEGGFQSKSFLVWCKKQGIIQTDGQGNPKKVVTHNGMNFRAVVIRNDYGHEPETLDFTEDLPFK